MRHSVDDRDRVSRDGGCCRRDPFCVRVCRRFWCLIDLPKIIDLPKTTAHILRAQPRGGLIKNTLNSFSSTNMDVSHHFCTRWDISVTYVLTRATC